MEAVLLEDDGSTVVLVVRASDAIRRRLVLRQARALQVANLRQGNIILEICLWDAASLLADRPQLVAAVRERLDLEVGALEPTTLVVHLTPTYGADVLAVCGEVHAEAG